MCCRLMDQLTLEYIVHNITGKSGEAYEKLPNML